MSKKELRKLANQWLKERGFNIKGERIKKKKGS